MHRHRCAREHRIEAGLMSKGNELAGMENAGNGAIFSVGRAPERLLKREIRMRLFDDSFMYATNKCIHTLS